MTAAPSPPAPKSDKIGDVMKPLEAREGRRGEGGGTCRAHILRTATQTHPRGRLNSIGTYNGLAAVKRSSSAPRPLFRFTVRDGLRPSTARTVRL